MKVNLEVIRPTSPDRFHPNRFFDRIFIINLDRCSKRWNQVTDNLLRHGIVNFERQPGISLPRHDPADLLPFHYYQNLEAYGGRFKTDANYILNCVGTNMAHQAIYRKSMDRGYTRILVLEDDVFLAPGALTRFRNAAHTLYSQPWHLAYLGYKRSRSNMPNKRVSPLLLRPKQFIRGAYGYAIHRSLFPILLKQPPFGGMEIDVFFEFVVCKMGSALCFETPIISHRDGQESTITNGKWKGRTF